ncbi:ATP-dependent helicase HrpB [Sulfurimonas autotrophica]|uniref:ATP-dependent helicase HrpB n=1 Tax=Sulfurimonas autotrophica (strain ATCC BAA-671 / DSM 16294 / JCM 11897 / OK10) TaxID=563040 RepID=E0URG7_SULAO|nr:ATP-dependent helicase HrpB [Sulfurimonas autotrophica]ADN10053.1 ATP-dependent helicase HrpB [Sulfurimonas autotrophica DSM 16294]
MRNLPIHDVLENVKNSLKTNNRLILQAPPGAGKSTVVPISLLDEAWLGDKMIIMLEPRRVATRTVASQMAKLLGEELRQSVGYQVKRDSVYTKQTKILVVTEAILVRKLQSNQTLDDVAMIIFDEFHERSIHTDLSLALSLQVQELLRDDLKILIMSATLDSNELSSLLGEVPLITSKGRMYEVTNKHLDIKTKQPDARSLNSLLLNTTLKAIKENKGDILVFLAGVKEIKNLQSSLLNSLGYKDILILPLYSSLPKNEQDKALSPSSKRKIILSTNIAQTSLTIEGVRVVIDSGLEKQSRYNYSNAMNHLETTFISKDSAVQRAGRAGRLSSGVCYRLWHESKPLQQSTKPEILRTDLSSLVLDLALWGVEEFNELKFLDIPNQKIIQETKKVLKELAMLDDSFKITPFGKDALSLGLHPRFAYMILKANDLGFAYEACLLASLLGEKDIFKNSSKESDILSRYTHLFEKDFNSEYINRFRAKEVVSSAEFFYKKLKSIKKVAKKNSSLNKDILSVLLLFAYPDRLARRRANNDNKYILSNGKGALLHDEDSLFNQEYLVVANLHAHDKDSVINLALSITMADIEQYFSSFILNKESITYNKEAKKFGIRKETYFLQLLLHSKPLQPSAKQDLTKLLVELIKKEGLEILTWSKKATRLKNRVNFLNHHQEFTDFSDEALLDSLDDWLAPYLSNITSIKELEALDVYTMLLSLLPWDAQQLLDTQAPPSIKVPSDSNIYIDYADYEKPSLHVKIQEVFGLHETPKVLNNTLPLQIHLLTPAMTPIQITYDLKSFWENSYAEVRKEVRGRYKRHYWPENPFEAVATNKTKKHMMKS